MKFAIAALIACASAIKIQSSTKKSCVTKEMANRGFDDLDTNGNGSLDYDEIKTGIQDLADQMDFTPTEEDWAWVIATGTAIDKKTPGKVDRREFRKFARAVFKHFGLCAMIEEHEEEHSLITQDADTQGPPPAGGDADTQGPPPAGGCVDHEMAMEGFHHLDTDHSGSLDYGEIQVGIEDLAKMGDYTPTTADWNWIKTTGAAIDTKNPGSVDEEEFYTFSNDVFNHFGICAQMHLPREGDSGDSGDHHDTTGPMPPMDHGDHHDTTGPMPPMDHGDHHDTTGPMPPMDHGDHHDTTGPATVEPMATTA